MSSERGFYNYNGKDFVYFYLKCCTNITVRMLQAQYIIYFVAVPSD